MAKKVDVLTTYGVLGILAFTANSAGYVKTKPDGDPQIAIGKAYKPADARRI